MNNVRKYTTALAALAGAWPLVAQTTAPDNSPKKDDVIVLSPFEVNAADDNGYQATQTLAGTRIRTDLKDIGTAVSVVTKQLMEDIGATDNATLLQYTTNTEVAGVRGTYAGLGNATTLDESTNLRSPAGAQRIRGLAAADNTRDYYITDIPWDGYNVDRIDIMRGPNSFLFGLGSPAGIINASTRNAGFATKGEVQARFGSYGSWRTSLDYNQVLIKDVLAVRVDGLWDHQLYQQDGAFQTDKRAYGALRFDPQLFKNGHTSIKAKFENGKIDADRPRTLAPYNSITYWWDMNKLTASLATDPATHNVNLYSIGTNTSAVDPFLNGGPANQQQPIWFIDGNSNQTYQIYAGYTNTGALNASGVPQGGSQSLFGQNYSAEFLGITGWRGYAQAAKLPFNGQSRDRSLTDPSVFDFYNNLIDGPTKSEYEKWNAYNIDLSQTFWDDRVGVDFTYDRQQYRSGGEQLLGNPTISVDLNKNFQDFSVNPNYGRAYVTAGQGGGTSYESDRKYYRASLFGELRPRDFLHSEFLLKLIGNQRLNGVWGNEKYYNERLNWYMYAHSQAWDGYWNQTSGATDGLANRGPVAVIYLGGSLAGLSSASGANIPRITAPVGFTSGNVYSFASTWKNPPGVAANAPWTVPAGNSQLMFSPNVTYVTGGTALGNYQGYLQASNPANYVGWNSNFYDQLISYNNGADRTLINRAQKALRETNSLSGSYQGFFWDDAFVATLGWRYDEVKTKDKTAPAQGGATRGALNLSPGVYDLPADFPLSQIKKGHSTSESFVLHLNKLLPSNHDVLPINVSLTYAKSSNFQVTSIRRDMYGNALSDPQGDTKDYGVILSTKDGKYSFRAVKYKTNNTGNDTGLSGISGNILSIVRQGLKWRNVYLYQLGVYNMTTANQPNSRNDWLQTYGGGANPIEPGLTQAQADAERDDAITTWNTIQKDLAAKGFFSAWNFTGPTGPGTALVDRATYLSDPAKYAPDPNTVGDYSAATAPQGFTVTADTLSKGYEFELTANPLPNLRLALTASETTAVRNNFGGPALDEFVSYMQTKLVKPDGTPTNAGKLAQFGNATQFSMFLDQWTPFYAQYQLLKAQEGADVPELRKWRYALTANYTFLNGFLKNVGVGGSYRWQDKIAIGYPVLASGLFDVSSPYYGPSESSVDLWASYERRLSKKLNWKVQLNIRNAFAKDGLVPLTVEPDGTWAAARIKPVQEWFVTNTLSF